MAAHRKPSSDVFNHSTPPQFIAPFSLPPLRSQQFPPGVTSLGKQLKNEGRTSSRLRRNANLSGITDPAPSPNGSKFMHGHGLSPKELVNELIKEPHSKLTIKILVKLRLNLSTESLRWLEDFILNHKGLHALENVVNRNSAPHLLNKDIPYSRSPFGVEELKGPIQLELMKCLKVIMNADLGFEHVLELKGLIRWLAYSSYAPSPSYKAKIHATEILSAICSLSLEHGRSTVVRGFLSLAPNPEEGFQGLINSLGAERTDELESQSRTSDPLRAVEADSENLSLVWDYRCRALGLCNSIGTGGLYWYGLLVKADINDAIFRLSANDPPAAFTAQVEAWNSNLGGPDSPLSNHNVSRSEPSLVSTDFTSHWSSGSIKSLMRLINQLEPSQKSELERWSCTDDSIHVNPPDVLRKLLNQKSRIGSHTFKKSPLAWTDVAATKPEVDNGDQGKKQDGTSSHTK